MGPIDRERNSAAETASSSLNCAFSMLICQRNCDMRRMRAESPEIESRSSCERGFL
jgi:hypothetical protein